MADERIARGGGGRRSGNGRPRRPRHMAFSASALAAVWNRCSGRLAISLSKTATSPGDRPGRSSVTGTGLPWARRVIHGVTRERNLASQQVIHRAAQANKSLRPSISLAVVCSGDM